MQPREPMSTAIEYQTPDRTPRDIGSFPVTGIQVKACKDYLKKYGYEKLSRELEILDHIKQLAKIHEEILLKWKVDTRGVWASPSGDWALKIEEDKDHFKFTDDCSSVSLRTGDSCNKALI